MSATIKERDDGSTTLFLNTGFLGEYDEKKKKVTFEKARAWHKRLGEMIDAAEKTNHFIKSWCGTTVEREDRPSRPFWQGFIDMMPAAMRHKERMLRREAREQLADAQPIKF